MYYNKRHNAFYAPSNISPPSNTAHRSSHFLRVLEDLLVSFIKCSTVRGACHCQMPSSRNAGHKHIIVYPYLPYSLNLEPCVFWIFSKVKLTTKGKHFKLIENSWGRDDRAIKDVLEEGLPEVRQKVVRRVGWCVRSKEKYFEGS